MAIQPIKLTGKTIKAKDITNFIRNEGTQRDNLQVLIEACIDHAQLNNNAFDLLSQLINGLLSIKARNTRLVTSYIQKHVVGIKWATVDKETGAKAYKKISKKTKVEYKPITFKWYEDPENMKDQKVAKLNLAKRINALHKEIMESLGGEGKPLEGDAEQARELMRDLEKYMV